MKYIVTDKQGEVLYEGSSIKEAEKVAKLNNRHITEDLRPDTREHKLPAPPRRDGFEYGLTDT